jgi:hypothetical protein
MRYLHSYQRATAAGRNACIREVNTDLFGTTDDDCNVDYRWLEEIVSALEKYHRIHLTVRAVTVCREYDIAVAATGETERKLRAPVRAPEIYFTTLYAYDALHRLMGMNRVPGIALMFAAAQFVAKS